ncbi:MAG TPA: SIS domain-containing protein [Patescibacteria group bacterium]|nr:SIS domain-containing protein [Patescibacteria group bacterium]
MTKSRIKSQKHLRMRAKTLLKNQKLGFSEEYFRELRGVLDKLDYKQMEKMVNVIWKAYKSDKTIFFMGNGGSASTATHLAADIGKNTVIVNSNSKRRFKTVALTDNVAWMTALGNDLSYEDIFVEQLKNFVKKGDVVVGISGSGNSMNVVKAIEYANEVGATTAGLLGFSGGKMLKIVDVPVLVPVDHYGYVEGVHSEIHHYLVEALKILKKNENLH